MGSNKLKKKRRKKIIVVLFKFLVWNVFNVARYIAIKLFLFLYYERNLINVGNISLSTLIA